MTQTEENKTEVALTRAELLKMLTDAVKIVAGKVTAQRLRENSQDQTRLAYARVLAQLATPILTALKDAQYDEIHDKVLQLEEEMRKYDGPKGSDYLIDDYPEELTEESTGTAGEMLNGMTTQADNSEALNYSYN